MRTQAVVLRCIDFSESSQVAALITPDLGQVHALAKGSRRPRKDGRLPLQPLSHCDIVLARKPAGQLNIVAEWTLRENFPRIGEDLDRFTRGFYGAEIVLAFATEAPEDGAFCGRLLELLRRLNLGEPPDMALFRFLTQALEAGGHRPVVDCCAHCRRGLDGAARFSPASGGALCSGCAGVDPSAFAISRGALAVMAHFALRGGRDASGLRLNAAQAGEIRRAFNEQMQYYLGRPLRSARFLAASAQQGAAPRPSARE